MFTYDCILAAALLTTPVESEQLVPHLELIQPILLQLAIDAEVLDPREEQYLQGMSKDPRGDYHVLRKRFDAFDDAPMTDEARRFPQRNLIEDFLSFNRAYRKELVEQLRLHMGPVEQLRTALSEVDQLYQVWSAVRDARCGFYYVTVRRQSLRELRELIGAEAFYSSQLPPHVPIWHFPRLR